MILVTREGREVARIEKKSEPEHDTVGAYQYTGPLVDGKRPVGLCKGEVFVAEDFDAPLPDEILDAFEGR